jgi:late competence protein required for DNA uptake (superfamily II DNA/RNA helicase)
MQEAKIRCPRCGGADIHTTGNFLLCVLYCKSCKLEFADGDSGRGVEWWNGKEWTRAPVGLLTVLGSVPESE